MRARQRRIHTSRYIDTVDPIEHRVCHYDRLLSIYDKGLNWVTKLKSHTSCVNAVNFSQNGGRWMASGGDDLRILLWDMHQYSIKKPQHTFVGPTKNIFELAFTATNKYLLCGGVDSAVRRYDFENIGQSFDPDPINVFRQHDDSIRGITPHITNDELYLTASQDGRLFLHDARAPAPVGHLISKQGWVGIQFHPRLEHLFLGATEHGNGRITLFDIRKCWSTNGISDDKELTRYLTLPYADKPVNSSLCGIAFDRSGERFASVSQGHYPVVYTLSDSYPIAVCTAKRRPNGELVLPTERNYSNSCTIKHVSFGGPSSSFPSRYSSPTIAPTDTDQFLATGSDDFRGYVWAIPSSSYLLDRRQEIEHGDEWSSQGQYGYKYSNIDNMQVPVHLEQPAFRLGGHQSIVNTAKWHPTMPRIATCGIESKVVLHESCGALEGSEEVSSDKVRKRMSGSRRRRIIGRPLRLNIVREVTGETSKEISEDEDKDTILYFDETLADDEEQNRRMDRVGRQAIDLLEDDDEDDWRGGEGGIEGLEETAFNRRDRALMMALFVRFLSAAGRREADDESTGVGTRETDRNSVDLTRLFGQDMDVDEEEDGEAEDEDEGQDEDMDTSL